MLIEIFTDFIRNKKDLREYVEIRKTINERGEFNDQKLLQVQENLERLKKENLDIYNKMYEVLEEVYRRDEGNYIEYSLNFAGEILKMYKTHQSVENIYQEYKAVLEHTYQTVN
jgi:predicted nuclease with TOPRIM domain